MKLDSKGTEVGRGGGVAGEANDPAGEITGAKDGVCVSGRGGHPLCACK